MVGSVVGWVLARQGQDVLRLAALRRGLHAPGLPDRVEDQVCEGPGDKTVRQGQVHVQRKGVCDGICRTPDRPAQPDSSGPTAGKPGQSWHLGGRICTRHAEARRKVFYSSRNGAVWGRRKCLGSTLVCAIKNMGYGICVLWQRSGLHGKTPIYYDPSFACGFHIAPVRPPSSSC